jgi:CRISPR/Cas system CSM-associated protein Csm3 (group 7 of RAMP superfamily)
MTVCCFKLSATLITDSSVHIGSGKRTGVIKHSLSFIPGTIIRGSIGNCLLRISSNENSSSELLSSLFSEEPGKSSKIFFKHCYPLHLKCDNSRGVFLPVPRTLFKCQNRQCGRLYNTFEPPLQCETCGKSVKAALGFKCDSCGEISSMPVSMKRISSTAIDRASNSAAILATTSATPTATMNPQHVTEWVNEDKKGIERATGNSNNDIISSSLEDEEEKHGLLHTIETIERGTKFALEIVLDSSCQPILDKVKSLLIRGLEDEGIGGSKSRGFGNVSIKDIKVQEITTESLERQAQSYYSNNNKSLSKFSVHLLSPLVVENAGANLEPSTLLEGARRAYSWCFKEGKPSLPDLVKLKQIFSYEVFGGWSLKEERNRRPAVSISSGSAFLFECPSPTPVLGKALASLECYSIGGYKSHGYGQVRVSVP